MALRGACVGSGRSAVWLVAAFSLLGHASRACAQEATVAVVADPGVAVDSVSLGAAESGNPFHVVGRCDALPCALALGAATQLRVVGRDGESVHALDGLYVGRDTSGDGLARALRLAGGTIRVHHVPRFWIDSGVAFGTGLLVGALGSAGIGLAVAGLDVGGRCGTSACWVGQDAIDVSLVVAGATLAAAIAAYIVTAVEHGRRVDWAAGHAAR